MSSTTPNLGLTKTTAAETIGQNWAASNDSGGNFDIIDTKMGAVGNTSLQAQVNALSSKMTYYEDKVVVPVGNYWTQRDAFKASRAGNVITFQGYFQITTEIPNGTKFASVGYTVNSGTVLIAEIGTGKAYPALVNYSDGTLQSEGAIPTGYYRIGGCCTMQASAL